MRLRITGGEMRGRSISTPSPKSHLGITLGKVREAVFSIIGEAIIGAEVLDLFAGVGSYGIEALSRGALFTTFVENSRYLVRILQKNIHTLGIRHRARVLMMDALTFIDSRVEGNVGYKFIFADPPYRKELAIEVLERVGKKGLLMKDGLFIVEHENSLVLPQEVKGLKKTDRRDFGQTSITFYQNL